MNIYTTKLFPYVAGDSLVGREVPMTIKSFSPETVTGEHGQEDGYILYFNESKKGLILNKTNAKAIAKAYGKETDDWVNRPVILYAERGKWFGEWHEAARVKVPGNGQATKSLAHDPGPDWDSAPGQDDQDYAAASAKADVDAANADLLGT